MSVEPMLRPLHAPADPPAAPSPFLAARERRRLSVDDAAQRAGLTAEEVVWLEEGRVYRFPSTDAALAAAVVLAAALDIDLREARGLARDTVSGSGAASARACPRRSPARPPPARSSPRSRSPVRPARTRSAPRPPQRRRSPPPWTIRVDVSTARATSSARAGSRAASARSRTRSATSAARTASRTRRPPCTTRRAGGRTRSASHDNSAWSRTRCPAGRPSPARRRGRRRARPVAVRDALLLVDVVNDFRHEDADAPLDLRTRHRMLLETLETARGRDVPVVYANDNFGDWHGDASRLVNDAVERGRGGELVAGSPEGRRPLRRQAALLRVRLDAAADRAP